MKWSQLTLEEAVESPDSSIRSLVGPVSAGFESFRVTGLGLAMECLESGDVSGAVQIVTSLVRLTPCSCWHHLCVENTGSMNTYVKIVYWP